MPRKRKQKEKPDVWRQQDVSELDEREQAQSDEGACENDDDGAGDEEYEGDHREETDDVQYPDPAPTEPDDEEQDDVEEATPQETYGEMPSTFPGMSRYGSWVWWPATGFQPMPPLPMPPRDVCLAEAKPKWLAKNAHHMAWERFKARMSEEQKLQYLRELTTSTGRNKKSLEQRTHIQRRLMDEANQ